MKKQNGLNLFHQTTSDWFLSTFGAPTEVQKAAWPAIANGAHTLVCAPTGTGKTLSAFLVFLDKLKALESSGELNEELMVIYVSPLKSLAGDIRENLNRPLLGISAGAINVAVRTGDTPQKERQRMGKHPPHILITTPESLYLMVTSKSGRKILHTAKAVIIDELHALIETKRGAHFMLSIARLDKLCGRPLQRIGLSATIEPLDVAAAYLSPDPVVIAAPAVTKKIQLSIVSPFSDDNQAVGKDPIWQRLAAMVFEACQGKRSVIAFTEGRRYAEKLAYYVNLIGGGEFAKTHHGSLSKRPVKERSMEQRIEDSFDRMTILCRETAKEEELPWAAVLEKLRVWEYTGQVRRGYFVEGMSGAQFIRDRDFSGVIQALGQSDGGIRWMNAVDPYQVWGKALPHLEGRSFVNVPGSVVALKDGIPSAVFERQGKTLRCFDTSGLTDVLSAFAADFKKRRLYPALKRLIVKEYPQDAKEALINAGFLREMQDYVLYR